MTPRRRNANGLAAKKANASISHEGPVRQCVGCRDRLAQASLVRFVRAGNDWKADAPGGRGKLPGRGAYLCSVACIARVAKNKRYPGLAAFAAECGLIGNS